MPLPPGAMTGGLTATTVSQGQGTGKALGREADTGQELPFPSPQTGRLTTLRVDRSDFHLSVIIHSDNQYYKALVHHFLRFKGRVTAGTLITQKGETEGMERPAAGFDVCPVASPQKVLSTPQQARG